MSQRRAFTLVELLVVIGIILILAALMMPAIGNAVKSAARARELSDLNAIAVALDAYKNDFGSYPPVQYRSTGPLVLTKALLGMGDAVSNPPTYAYTSGTTNWQYRLMGTEWVKNGVKYVCLREYQQIAEPASDPANLANLQADESAMTQSLWVPWDTSDGENGPGFRVRSGLRPHLPYLQPDRISLRPKPETDVITGKPAYGAVMTNKVGQPILYFPVKSVKPNIFAAGTTSYPADPFGRVVKKQPYVDRDPTRQCLSPVTKTISAVDAEDNLLVFHTDPGNTGVNGWISLDYAMRRIRIMLGDYNYNGYIEPALGEQSVLNGPFILWSSGPDRFFGGFKPYPDYPANPDPNYNRLRASGTDDAIYCGGAVTR